MVRSSVIFSLVLFCFVYRLYFFFAFSVKGRMQRVSVSGNCFLICFKDRAACDIRPEVIKVHAQLS